MKDNYLIVREVSNSIKDKNDNEYKIITVESKGVITQRGEEFKSPVERGKILAWAKSYKDGFPDFGYHLAPGDKIIGEVVSMPVEPYDIVDRTTGEVLRTALSYTTVVLGDSNKSNWNYRVHEAFTKQGKKIRELPLIV